jgi:hypothetical protein
MLVIERIAGLADDEHQLDLVECSERPCKPTRYVPVNRIPSSDPGASSREMTTGLKRGREDSDKLRAWAKRTWFGHDFDGPSVSRRTDERRSWGRRHAAALIETQRCRGLRRRLGGNELTRELDCPFATLTRFAVVGILDPADTNAPRAHIENVTVRVTDSTVGRAFVNGLPGFGKLRGPRRLALGDCAPNVRERVAEVLNRHGGSF